MTTREQVAFGYDEWSKRRIPSSWFEKYNLDVDLTFLDSYLAGCIHTYIYHVEQGGVLDEWRTGILHDCREVLMKARPLITDDEGHYYLELALRMAEAILTEANEINGGTGP